METAIFERLGLSQKLRNSAVINGKSGMDILNQLSHAGDSGYHPCPEANPGPGVPRGALERIERWQATTSFTGTEREIVVYLPPNLERAGPPANVLVVNDGGYYLDEAGQVRAPAVLDSLIARGEIPATVGVFIEPGTIIANDAAVVAAMDHEPGDQRSYEYDRLTGDYARMLADEVLPMVEGRFAVPLSRHPARTAICGVSSGGIAAFNTAWHMPERFGCVISHCGSFTNIHGGHNFPYLVRMTQRKPIRVWMQSGEHDANVPWGNWALANKVMADAFAYAGYDMHFEFGTGAHNLRHGGSLFADTLRWLWS